MLANRSIPQCRVIPQLVYTDVQEAAAWLCAAFGFTMRLGIGDHRAQLNVGDGAIVVMEPQEGDSPDAVRQRLRAGRILHSVMVRVEDANRHHDQAREHGARILRPPVDYPYGERQYSAEDFAGHVWTFSQSIADVDPRQWGGVPGQL